jgi:hypothetical protein
MRITRADQYRSRLELTAGVTAVGTASRWRRVLWREVVAMADMRNLRFEECRRGLPCRDFILG